MMRSLYSGVSGLRTHQTKMDVIGNNIANVNTVGFKSSQVLFKDVLYQTTQSATAATATAGGTNAKQIGLGTTTATIATNQNNGSAQSTNNPYDLMINGSSFFVVNRGGVNYFTKVGAFKVDDAGNLVTGNGEYVMGWQVDPDDPNAVRRDTVSALRPRATEFLTAPPQMTSKTNMTGYIVQTDPSLELDDDGNPAGQGISTTVKIYDNLGYSYDVKFKITANQDEGSYKMELVSIKDQNGVDIIHDELNDDGSVKTPAPYQVAFESVDDDGVPYDITDPSIVFDIDSGKFVTVGDGTNVRKAVNLRITPADGSTKGNVFQDHSAPDPADWIDSIEIDCSSLKMYYKGELSDVETHRGSTGASGEIEGAGRTVGGMTDVQIDTNGKMYGVYDNGVTRLLGQIAVAVFDNPLGLEAIGNSLFRETKASGEFDGIGKDISSAGETMTQGVLEMSNVDLSQEFTEMIVTQRGFQANSRIITVSDTLIEELVNLKR